MNRPRKRLLSLAGVVLALSLAGTAAAATGSSSDGGGSGPAPVQSSDAGESDSPPLERHDGLARALPLSEVRARGLEKYVDPGKYQERTPKLSASTVPPTPERKTSGEVSPLASGCWEHSYWYGNSQLKGQTDVTWCGDGLNAVTYSASGCWGDEAWVTYLYVGCDLIEDFGHPKPDEYWNVYHVWTKWDLCPIAATQWGGCFLHSRPWAKYWYGADGAWGRMGGTE